MNILLIVQCVQSHREPHLWAPGRIQEAIALYRWFMPLLELDINSKLVQNIKLAEVYTEIGTEFVRPPRLPLFGTERTKVQHIIEMALKSRPTLPNY